MRFPSKEFYMTVKFTIPESLPSYNKIFPGGNAKGNFHIRRKFHDEWKAMTLAGLAQSRIRHYSLEGCKIHITSYYFSHQVDADNIYCKAVLDALKGRIFDDDSPKYVKTVTKTSEKCLKGEERTEVVVEGLSTSPIGVEKDA